MQSVILKSYTAIKRERESERIKGLTKYVVGANANPPKNPRRPPKKGNVMATNIVNAESNYLI